MVEVKTGHVPSRVSCPSPHERSALVNRHHPIVRLLDTRGFWFHATLPSYGFVRKAAFSAKPWLAAKQKKANLCRNASIDWGLRFSWSFIKHLGCVSLTPHCNLQRWWKSNGHLAHLPRVRQNRQPPAVLRRLLVCYPSISVRRTMKLLPGTVPV